MFGNGTKIIRDLSITFLMQALARLFIDLLFNTMCLNKLLQEQYILLKPLHKLAVFHSSRQN